MTIKFENYTLLVTILSVVFENTFTGVLFAFITIAAYITKTSLWLQWVLFFGFLYVFFNESMYYPGIKISGQYLHYNGAKFWFGAVTLLAATKLLYDYLLRHLRRNMKKSVKHERKYYLASTIGWIFTFFFPAAFVVTVIYDPDQYYPWEGEWFPFLSQLGAAIITFLHVRHEFKKWNSPSSGEINP